MGYLLHHFLSASAQRDPDATAVRHLTESLTYGALEARSNQLARALLESGVVAGDRVGIHLGKSLDAIIGLFGVMKAGACYVPVDVNSPGRRLAGIARQCAMKSLITSSAAAAKLSEFAAESPLQSIFLTDQAAPVDLRLPARIYPLAEAIAQQGPEPLDKKGTDQDLAYVLFTSGSTGEPKGVMLSHLNALTFVNWAIDTFGIGPGDRLSNHAPLNFDLSVLDIFAGVKAGACVSLIPDGLSSFPIRLAQLIEEHRLTVWYSVPSVLTLLLTHGKLDARSFSSLRLVLFAGEVFPVKYLRQLMKVVPHPRYFNLYGPTETNVCTYYEVASVPAEETSSIPIGRACANSDVFALDENGHKIDAPGREGLLYARGSTVMQGYFGRPKETQAAFSNNPFATGRDEKIYCTGDWVSMDHEGNFLFLGRKDHMVKTRGYRVELGEIESAVYAHPSVREAVAIAIPDDLLGSRIKVFVVANGETTLTAAEVQAHCATRLPRYMVPEEVEFKEILPRTGTGKVDRPRLTAAETESPATR
jgi:amino acid adenylation domain-containing protein